MGIDQRMAQPDQEDDQQQGTPLSDAEELDLKIGVLLGEHLLENGGFDTIQKAMKSSDPGQVIGQFLLQMGQQMMESMPDDMKLSPKILLTKGGWLEQISDYIQEKLHTKKNIMDKAEIYVASTAQQMAKAKQQQSADGSIDGVPAPPVPGPGSPVGGPAPAQQPPTMPMAGGQQ